MSDFYSRLDEREARESTAKVKNAISQNLWASRARRAKATAGADFVYLQPIGPSTLGVWCPKDKRDAVEEALEDVRSIGIRLHFVE